MDDTLGNEPTINLVNPAGDLVSVPHSQVADALNSSYRQPTDQDVAAYQHHEKYGALPEQIKTGLESGASALTFGGSKGLERMAGVNPEDIQAREEENPGSSLVGSIGGLGLQTALMGGTNLLEQAGAKGAQALGLGLEGAGLASRLGANAVKGAIEGAAFQGGNEVGKMLLSNPSQQNPADMVETAAVNMGLAGLLGGGLGVGVGALGEGAKGLWNATTGRKVGQALESAQSELNSSQPKVNFIDTTSPENPLSEQGQGLLSGAQSQKPNSLQIRQAAQRLGIPDEALSPGTLSNDLRAQHIEGDLVNNAETAAGQSARADYKKMYDPLESNADDILSGRFDKDYNEVGKELKEGSLKVLKDKLSPIEQGYKELKPVFKDIEVSPDLKEAHLDPLINNEALAVAPKLKSVVNDLLDQFQGVKNLDQLKTLGTNINDQLSDAYKPGGDAAKAKLLESAKQAVKGIRESALQGAEFSGKFGIDTLQKIKNLDLQYADYKNLLQRMGVESGVGQRIGSARQLLDKYANLSDESFIKSKRFLDPNDINQMQFMKQNFPEQYELAASRLKQDIYDNTLSNKAGENKAFRLDKFNNEMNKLRPNAKIALFGEDGAQKIADIQTMHGAIPGNPSPTLTHRGINIGNFMSLKGIVNEGSDALKYAWLRAAPHLNEAVEHMGSTDAAQLGALKAATTSEKSVNPSAFKSMVDFVSNTIKGENTLSKAASNIFESGKQIIPSTLIPDDKKIDKLDKKLLDIQGNNAQMLNNQSDLGHYMPDHEAALAQSSMNAVNYLNSLRPSTAKTNPLDADPVVSQFQKTAFKNALTIAEQPLVVLNDIKDGSISPQDIVTMKTIYPALYGRVSNKLYTNLMDHANKGLTVPYQTRLGLSLFLARPLDSTMTPQAVSSNQPQNNAALTSNDKEKMATHGSGAHSMKNIGQIATLDQTPQQARVAQKLKA